MRNDEDVENNVVENSLMSQEEFVTNVLNHYRINDIVPGDPNEGRWEECHYPVPKCLGGTDTVLLLKEHHAVQGVLQSEELDHPCVWGWEKKFLKGTVYEPLLTKWLSLKSQRPKLAFWKDKSPDERLLITQPGLLAASSPEAREKMRQSMIGKRASEETKLKMRGPRGPNKCNGELHRQHNLNRPTTECPHCGRTVKVCYLPRHLRAKHPHVNIERQRPTL